MPTSSRKSLAGQPWLILAAVITIYIVLGVLYESFVHPFTILTTLPSAGIGALLALMLCGMDLSMMALIGIVLLMGIVKKNAIMMIDFALEAERTQGLTPRDAIVQACLLRFRPIMMTTLAALFGALPLALESGTGSELRNPLGVTIVGGLLLTQLLTLYTTPVIYLAMERVRARLAPAPARRRPSPGPVSTAGPPAGRRSRRHELLAALHRAADRHHAAGARPAAAGARRLSLPAGGEPAVGRVRRPSASRPACPAPTPRPWRRRVAAPLERRLGEIAGVTEMTSVSSLGSTRITIQFDLTRNIDGAAQRRAGGPQRRRRRPAGRHADAAALPQVQSGGRADPDPGADVQDHPAERHVRRRRHRHRPAHLARSKAWPR